MNETEVVLSESESPEGSGEKTDQANLLIGPEEDPTAWNVAQQSDEEKHKTHQPGDPSTDDVFMPLRLDGAYNMTTHTDSSWRDSPPQSLYGSEYSTMPAFVDGGDDKVGELRLDYDNSEEPLKQPEVTADDGKPEPLNESGTSSPFLTLVSAYSLLSVDEVIGDTQYGPICMHLELSQVKLAVAHH